MGWLVLTGIKPLWSRLAVRELLDISEVGESTSKPQTLGDKVATTISGTSGSYGVSSCASSWTQSFTCGLG